MLKKYHCVDKFMIRVPAFPVNALKKISDFGADDSTKNFLNTLGNYEDYFLQSLYISSKSLYESVTSNKCDIRKNHNAMVALQKYFIRNCVRPTPFGLCSGVALGNFADKTDMCLDPEKYNLDVTVDFAWLLNIIAKMENDKNILNQLKIKWNKNCFVSGDRIKNPCFSGHGVEGRENLAFQEVNLKRTKLIDLIRKFSDYWIPYYKLTNLIQESYPSVPRGKIEDVLKSLLDNELLLTELRIPAYCADPLKHIFSIVEHKDVQIGYKEELIAIENILKKYRERPNLNLCKEIYSSMERLYPCKNYIEVNRGHFFRSASLSYQIKDKLESFAEFLSEVAVMPEEYSELNDFREKFIEEYGLGIEVPIFDVIDQNKFDGLHYISPAPIRSEREDKIRQIVDKKILFTILESKDEVKLSRTDFSGLENKNIESYSTSFDLNFYITFDKQSHKHSIVVGPNVGAAKSGMMFQRFKNVFNVEQFAEYNQC